MPVSIRNISKFCPEKQNNSPLQLMEGKKHALLSVGLTGLSKEIQTPSLFSAQFTFYQRKQP